MQPRVLREAAVASKLARTCRNDTNLQRHRRGLGPGHLASCI